MRQKERERKTEREREIVREIERDRERETEGVTERHKYTKKKKQNLNMPFDQNISKINICSSE